MRTYYAAVALVALLATPVFASPVASILDANKAASGGKAWDDKATLNTESDYSGQGLTGMTTYQADLKHGWFANNYTIGPASGANGFDGTHAWMKDPSGTVTIQEGGDSRQLMVNEAYRNANLWWRADRGGATVTSDGQKTDDGATYDVIAVVPKDGKPFHAWFDAKTHLLSRVIEKQGSQTITSTLSDYRATDGVKLAGKLVIDDGEGPKYFQTLTLTSAKFTPAQDASVYAAPKVTVTDFSIAGGAAQAAMPIQVLNNHIYADVMVNGKGPFTFIFDTGGANLVTPSVAKELGLKSQGHMDVHGAGVGIMEAGLTKIDELKIGNAALKNQVFVVLPLDAMSNVEGIKETGMVGFETFRRFVTRIDYAGKTLTLIDPKHFDPKDAGTPVKFVFSGSIPEIKGTFEGIPGTFEIDTGSRAGLTLTKPFAEKIDFRAKHPKGIDCVDGWGVGGPSTGYVARGKMLMIGDVKVPNIVTSFATQSKGAFAGNEYSGNIGSGILKRFVVTFDYNNKVMYLKPATVPLTDVGTFDRSGMWINDSQGGFEIVDVTAKGPADTAGLKKNDVIVSVDGKPAGEIKLADLRQRLRNEAPGTKVKLGLQSGKMVTLTLRDQI
jgi:Aspartyl protease/PDZ domain